MKSHLFILIVCCTLFSACVPLTQIRYRSTRGDIRICPDTPLSVNLHTPTQNRKEQGELDTKASFATRPDGRRFSLIAEKIPYVENYPQPSYFLTRNLYLVSSSGTRHRAWPHGDWQVHIERSSPRGRETYDTSFELYTLIWTPFLGTAQLMNPTSPNHALQRL